jgi:HEAT repeat protein
MSPKTPVKSSRRDPLEERLNAVSALRREAVGPELLAKLRAALADSHNQMVARAARVAGDLALGELEPELKAAFERVMADPYKLDKGCSASKAIVEALLTLEADAPAIFRRGLRHVQKEPAFGGPVDVAIELRANCAMGLAGTAYPEVVVDLVPLLIDPAEFVRSTAARAIASAARVDSEAVLRLKALVGDPEPDVISECLTGLMRLSPERSFDLIEEFLRKDDLFLKKAAMLALGEARHPQAVKRLIELWPSEIDRDARRVLLLALATSRREEAFEFLVELVAESNIAAAVAALDALAVFPQDSRLRRRVDGAIRASRHFRDLRSRLSGDSEV